MSVERSGALVSLQKYRVLLTTSSLSLPSSHVYDAAATEATQHQPRQEGKGSEGGGWAVGVTSQFSHTDNTLTTRIHTDNT